MLGDWGHEYDGSSNRASAARKETQTGRGVPSTVRQLPQAILARFPKVSRHSRKGTSISFFETTSAPPRLQLSSLHKPHVMLSSPNPSDRSEIDWSDDTCAGGMGKKKSADSLTALMHGIELDRRTNSTHQRADLRRTAPPRPPDEPHILSYEEVQELRIFPPPSQRTRVRFTPSSRTSNAAVLVACTLPANEAWRYPAGYVPRQA